MFVEIIENIFVENWKLNPRKPKKVLEINYDKIFH